VSQSVSEFSAHFPIVPCLWLLIKSTTFFECEMSELRVTYRQFSIPFHPVLRHNTGLSLLPQRGGKSPAQCLGLSFISFLSTYLTFPFPSKPPAKDYFTSIYCRLQEFSCAQLFSLSVIPTSLKMTGFLVCIGLQQPLFTLHLLGRA